MTSSPAPPDSDELHTWTIYHGAADVDAPYCVREWIAGPGTLRAAGDPVPAHSLLQARSLVPDCAQYKLPAAPDDDPVIVEVWL